MSQIRFLLNGSPVSLTDPAPDVTLLDWLRTEKGLTGTKEGCNEGDCGACTVTVTEMHAGQPRHLPLNACILFLPQLHGKSVETVEALADGKTLHPVQQAMVDHHGSQCGFCTPGFVMSLYTAQLNNRRDYDDVLAGNLCRCTGYAPIIRAAEAAETPASTRDATQLAALQSGESLSSEGAYLPTDLDAFAEWYRDNPKATLVAGATDVGLWVTKSLKHLRPMAFLHRLDALKTISQTSEGLQIGAGVTVEDLIPVFKDRHPGFAQMLRRYGSVQVRTAATIGGNIANGSPIGDSPPPLIALGARLTLRSGKSRRSMALEDFFVEYGRQDRHPGEFVESLTIPDQPDDLKVYKLSKRLDQDISAVCGAFNLPVQDGIFLGVRIAFGGMAGTPKRADAVERALEGRKATLETVTAALPAFGEDFTPMSDARASADYRLRSARNMLLRAFHEMNELAPAQLSDRGAA